MFNLQLPDRSQLDHTLSHKETFEVWPENMQALEVFLLCENQWRVITGMQSIGYQGLEYASVLGVIESLYARDPEEKKVLFFSVKDIERGALSVMNKHG